MNILITAKAATIITDGKPFTISRDHDKFEEVLAAYRDKDEAKLRRIIDAMSEVREWTETNSDGEITVRGGSVYYNGEYIDNAVADRILEWMDLDLDPRPMINFLKRLMTNPSYQSRQELLLFLEASDLPIQDDGRFLAYKMVRRDYKDCHTGTMDNSVGRIVEIPRGEVDDNRQNTCSAGLHFCSREYVGFFGDSRLMLLAVDPADVVSIPYDYNNSKGRACRYEVIEEVEGVKDFESKIHRTGQFSIVLEDQDGDEYYFDNQEFAIRDEGITFSYQDALDIAKKVDAESLEEEGFSFDWGQEYDLTVIDETTGGIVYEKTIA